MEHNIIRHCASTGPWGQSGISLWQAIALDRQPGFHNVVRGNILWNNSNPPNGTDGNGLIIDDFRNTQQGSTNGIYPNYTLVENNVAYHNGPAAFMSFSAITWSFATTPLTTTTGTTPTPPPGVANSVV